MHWTCWRCWLRLFQRTFWRFFQRSFRILGGIWWVPLVPPWFVGDLAYKRWKYRELFQCQEHDEMFVMAFKGPVRGLGLNVAQAEQLGNQLLRWAGRQKMRGDGAG